MKRAILRQGSAAEAGSPKSFWSLQIGRFVRVCKEFGTPCPLRAGGGGSTSQATTGRACCALYIRNGRKECKIHGFRVNHTLDGAKGRQK